MNAKTIAMVFAIGVVLFGAFLVLSNENEYEAENSETVTVGEYIYSLHTKEGLTAELISPSGEFKPGNGITVPDTIVYGGNTYNVVKIKSNAFISVCSEVKGSLKIGANVREIGEYAFSGCTGLTGPLTIPDSVEKVDSYAFFNCTGFNGSLKLSAKMTEIKSDSFCGCSGLTGSVTIPEGVLKIGSNAFYGCKSLSGTLTLPATLNDIGTSALTYTKFSEIKVNAGNVVFTSKEGILYEYGTTLYLMPGGMEKTDFTIPAGTIKIKKYAFEGCTGLKGTLTIPATVYEIGEYAFYGCTGLTGSLTIPFGTTEIKSSAFYGCTGLNGELSIPNGITKLEANAFDNTSFTKVTLGKLMTGIDPNAFAGWSFYDTDGTTRITDVTQLPGWSYVGTPSKMVRMGTPSEVTITFDTNGGTGSVDPIKTTVGNTILLPSYSGTKQSLTFGGWYLEGKTYQPGESYVVTKAVTFVAVWIGEEVTITFDTNGGTGTVDPIRTPAGKPINLPSYSGTKSGCTFDGWLLDGKTYKPGDSYTAQSNVTFKAVWKENGGSSGNNNTALIAGGAVALIAIIGAGAYFVIKKRP